MKPQLSHSNVQMKCPISMCRVTDDKRELQKSDLVVFDPRDPLPSSFRNKRPLLAYFLNEPPTPYSLNGINMSAFDWSITYQTGSHLAPSLHYRQFNMTWTAKKTPFNNRNRIHLNPRKRIVAAIIDKHDCKNADSADMMFVHLLGKHGIHVDVYGACGLPCADNTSSYTTPSSCLTYLSSNYMFFLAFEHSICDSYVTLDRFFRLLSNDIDMVPIVPTTHGHDHYVPRSAFIDASSFSSVNRFADHLLWLTTNETAYNGHFSWKRSGNVLVGAEFSVEQAVHSLLCDMCIKLSLKELLKESEKANRFDNNNEIKRTENCYHLKVRSLSVFNYTTPFEYEESTFLQKIWNFFFPKSQN